MILTMKKKFKNWTIFDEVIRRTKLCQFWATLYICVTHSIRVTWQAYGKWRPQKLKPKRF